MVQTDANQRMDTKNGSSNVTHDQRRFLTKFPILRSKHLKFQQRRMLEWRAFGVPFSSTIIVTTSY
jgi:hypothetical protein